jgi:hypothetical protein
MQLLTSCCGRYNVAALEAETFRHGSMAVLSLVHRRCLTCVLILGTAVGVVYADEVELKDGDITAPVGRLRIKRG